MLAIRARRGLTFVFVLVIVAVVALIGQSRAGAAPLLLRTSFFSPPTTLSTSAEPPLAPDATLLLRTSVGSEISVLTPHRDVPWTTAVTMLHGMCSDAQATCQSLAPGLGDLGLVVCPHGNGTCGGWADWQGDGATKAAHLDAAFEAVEVAFGDAASPRKGGILVGFSRGAFVARDVLAERPGAFRGAILVGAAFLPDIERFRRSGVQSVVLASGDHDGARKTMEGAARRLDAAGIRAKFVRLGPIYHALPARFDRFVRESIRWIDEPNAGAPS